ncbi:MAG: cyclin-dependent kinase inhibitor 3 family protein [Gammaproteobacteria bacterium]|nr:cyclin-dependent kinase inhibitor 3 family protein [Gammaproteobacteria bacterium]
MIRTSETHPLRIDAISSDKFSGKIGLTLCPGKYQLDGITGQWHRDLNSDLYKIKQWPAKVLISLMQKEEFAEYKVPNIGIKAEEYGIQWFHLPIYDRGVPDEEFELRWEELTKNLQELLITGHNIVFHCLGGLGRTGTIASKLLMDFGYSADEAISTVRHVRRGSIETFEQEQYLHDLMYEEMEELDNF